MVSRNKVLGLALVAGLAVLSGTPAEAYIGPGAGVSAIGALVALVVAALVAVLGFFWYPLKRLIKGGAESDPEIDDLEELTQESVDPQAENRGE